MTAELRALNARFINNFITNDVPGHDAILHDDLQRTALYFGVAGQTAGDSIVNLVVLLLVRKNGQQEHQEES